MAKFGIQCALLFEVTVILMVIFADRAEMLWPSQMLQHPERWGDQWFALVMNGAVWGNALLLPIAFGLIFAYCGDQWQSWQVSIAILIGMLGAWAFIKYAIIPGKYHDALAGAGEFHAAGIFLWIYLVGAIALLLLFAISPSPAPLTIAVCAILALYIVAANHVPLVMLKNIYHWSYCPDVFAEEIKPTVTLIVTELVVFLAMIAKLRYPSGLF